MKIACVGAGPSGLYLAILMKLNDERNDVTVYERKAPGDPHGWGVVFWDDLLSSLRKNDPQTAREILDHAFLWSGQVLNMQGRQPVRIEGGGFGMCRRQLVEILTKRAMQLGVKIHFDHEISSADQLPDADLIVGAEGVSSWLRQHHAERLGTRINARRNKYVWLGTSRVFKDFTFGFVPTSGGWIWCHAYAFRQDMSTFIVECSPETWYHLGLDKLDACEGLRRLETIFEQYLEGHRLVSVAPKGDRLPWLNFRIVTNERWYVDNIVLIGDAAHTTHFSIGAGTRFAVQDAIALAGALRDQSNIQVALQQYQETRKHELECPSREADLSARWFENVDRYISLETAQFLALLLRRRSRLMPHIPPRMYYGLCITLRWILRGKHKHAASMIANLYRRRPHLPRSSSAAYGSRMAMLRQQAIQCVNATVKSGRAWLSWAAPASQKADLHLFGVRANSKPDE